ncbi:hypothetical protein HYH03_007137 [Edaphochlamys debaryana]|uniref:EF-hand domain-containing protein n=1 Tax=Edaphochlamys debaryana TaxID=47281 RepID=A0A835Y4K8_9CHLO|nr:hypothetical protein HYH03_007137 [Edaphochlamys debaryana]|eukprot:KAG2494618.1 hypothetical protein HYH03_007137 [Edaphochlamys debaryana]
MDYKSSRLQDARDALSRHIRKHGGVATRHREAAQELMASIDVDGDGSVTWEEWAAAAGVSEADRECSYHFFQLLDADGSGTLSVDELGAFILLQEGSPFSCDCCGVTVLDDQVRGCRTCWRKGLLRGMGEDGRRGVAYCPPCAERHAKELKRCHRCCSKLEVLDNSWWLPLRDWPVMQAFLTDEEYRKVRIRDARETLMQNAQQLIHSFTDGEEVDVSGLKLKKKDFVKDTTSKCKGCTKHQASSMFKCFDLDGSGSLEGVEVLALAAAAEGCCFPCDGPCGGALILDDTFFTCKTCWREYQRGGFADVRLCHTTCVSCVRRSSCGPDQGEAPICPTCSRSMQPVPNEWWLKHEEWSTMRALRAGEEEAVARALRATQERIAWEEEAAAQAQEAKRLRRKQKREHWMRVGEKITQAGENIGRAINNATGADSGELAKLVFTVVGASVKLYAMIKYRKR